jgi:uncharacterized protein YecE (DUF72 family)
MAKKRRGSISQDSQQESFTFQARTGPEPRPPFDPRELSRLAAKGIYLGTSSWKYRGWEGLIYQGGYASEAQFQRASLREYTSYFPCVGVDFTYYAWPVADMMAYLVESTPENFRLCPKVTKRITMSSFPNLPAYGKWAGKKNPDYLNADLFEKEFLTPIQRLKGRVGIVLFEFSGPEEEDLDLLRAFFRAIPRDFPYAVEIRNPELVRPDFYRLLAEAQVGPAFSFWTRMPRVSVQYEAYRQGTEGVTDSTPMVGLGFLKPGRSYEEAVSLFQPYKELKEAYPTGREELTELAQSAEKAGRKIFLLLNNRLEGSAPHTVGAVASMLSGSVR